MTCFKERGSTKTRETYQNKRVGLKFTQVSQKCSLSWTKCETQEARVQEIATTGTSGPPGVPNSKQGQSPCPC